MAHKTPLDSSANAIVLRRDHFWRRVARRFPTNWASKLLIRLLNPPNLVSWLMEATGIGGLRTLTLGLIRDKRHEVDLYACLLRHYSRRSFQNDHHSCCTECYRDHWRR